MVLDRYSRTVIGWALEARLTGDLTQQALSRAIRRHTPNAGLLHHSDQGSQYAATAYQQLLTTHGMAGSMSKRGHCWDNAWEYFTKGATLQNSTDFSLTLFARYAGRARDNVADRIQVRVLAWTTTHTPGDGSTHWSSRKLAAQWGGPLA